MSPNQMEEKIQTTITAWETLRPNKSFGGMTLEQFKARVLPSLAARTALAALSDQVQAAINQRDHADRTSLDEVQKMVKGVVGDPDEGDDGELYKALGYVPKSERKSGLSRPGNLKNKAASATANVTQNAA